jgi:6-phosphogluconolactonase (cycloisomerase 2 family)
MMKFTKLLVLLTLVCQPIFMSALEEGSFQEIANSPEPAGAEPINLAYSPVVNGNLFAAAANNSSDDISVYKVDQTTGAFTPVPGSPVPTVSTPFYLAFSPALPNNGLLAVVTNQFINMISVYSVDTTGAFTFISTFPTGSFPQGVEFSPLINGNLFAAVANFLDSSVSVYKVDTTTGQFTPVPGSPFATDLNPTFAAFSPIVGGNLFAAVSNFGGNSVSVYSVDTTSGMFTPVSGSPFPTEVGSGTFSVEFSPLLSNGNLFAAVSNFFSSQLMVFSVNTSTGAFSNVATVDTQLEPFHVIFSPVVFGELFAAVGNAGADTVSVYKVDQNLGAFTEVSGSPFAAGNTPLGISYSPFVQGNLFAAVADNGQGTITIYQVLLPPTVLSINPSQGPDTGGTSVVITGANFSNATAVNFGSTPASSFVINSNSQITAISPPGTGIVDVTVTTSLGTSATSSADQFTYTKTILPILPPTNLKGFQVANEFATQIDYVNILLWDPPASGEAVFVYKIYRNDFPGNLIAVVSGQLRPLRFEDHNRKKCKSYTYFIVSVDATGKSSALAILKIKGTKEDR